MNTTSPASTTICDTSDVIEQRKAWSVIDTKSRKNAIYCQSSLHASRTSHLESYALTRPSRAAILGAALEIFEEVLDGGGIAWLVAMEARRTDIYRRGMTVVNCKQLENFTT